MLLASSTFNDGDFQIPLFSNTILAVLCKVMYMYERTFEKLYRI